jgi:hypothetical protein
MIPISSSKYICTQSTASSACIVLRESSCENTDNEIDLNKMWSVQTMRCRYEVTSLTLYTWSSSTFCIFAVLVELMYCPCHMVQAGKFFLHINISPARRIGGTSLDCQIDKKECRFNFIVQVNWIMKSARLPALLLTVSSKSWMIGPCRHIPRAAPGHSCR